jgi:hypothetical protein
MINVAAGLSLGLKKEEALIKREARKKPQKKPQA